jgi:hypothetical protein
MKREMSQCCGIKQYAHNNNNNNNNNKVVVVVIIIIIIIVVVITVGRDSSVGVVTRYRLDGPGIDSKLRRDFPYTSSPALGPTQLPIQLAPGLSRWKNGRGVAFTTHPDLAPRLTLSLPN